MYALSCVFYEIFTGDIPFSNILRDSTVMLKTMSGDRPVRPSESSPPWKEWGLTGDIWSLMQECWKEEPTQRPSVGRVIERLHFMLTQDGRPSPDARVPSPATFRERMSDLVKLMTASDLDCLLSVGVNEKPVGHAEPIVESLPEYTTSPSLQATPGSSGPTDDHPVENTQPHTIDKPITDLPRTVSPVDGRSENSANPRIKKQSSPSAESQGRWQAFPIPKSSSIAESAVDAMPSKLEMTQRVVAHGARIMALQFSPDGKYLATSGNDGTAVVFRVAEPLIPHRRYKCSPAEGLVQRLFWTPSGNFLWVMFARVIESWNVEATGVYR